MNHIVLQSVYKSYPKGLFVHNCMFPCNEELPELQGLKPHFPTDGPLF